MRKIFFLFIVISGLFTNSPVFAMSDSLAVTATVPRMCIVYINNDKVIKIITNSDIPTVPTFIDEITNNEIAPTITIESQYQNIIKDNGGLKNATSYYPKTHTDIKKLLGSSLNLIVRTISTVF